jgi:hypothetical protein
MSFKNFVGSQADFLSYADNMVLLYNLHQNDFKVYNPVKFTPALATDLKEAINLAYDFPTDELVVDVISQRVEEVEAYMQQARKSFQLFKPFVELAYPNRQTKWNEFGFNDYDDVRSSTKAMLLFLGQVFRVADENRILLKSVGCNNDRIDDLKTIRDKLSDAHHAAEMAKIQRPQRTEERESLFDAVWNYVRAITRAGQLIFEGVSEAKRRQFLLPVRGTETKDSSIVANSKKALFDGEISADTMLQITNTGETDLTIYAANTMEEAQPTSAVKVSPSETKTLKVSEIATNVTASLIVISNNSTTKGEFRLLLLE